MVTECITLHLVLFPDISLRDTLGSYPLQFLHLSEEDGGGGGGWCKVWILPGDC